MSSRVTLMAVGLLLALVATGSNLNRVAGSTPSVPYVQSTSITVSADGDAAINQTLVMPQNATSVTIPLLSAEIGDILTLDQTGAPASYEIADTNITIYTLGATSIDLSYYTSSLTSKEGSVWTIDFTWEANCTLELPAQSTVLSLSSTPLSVANTNGVPVLVLGPGAWEVSYGLPIETSQTQTSSSGATGSSGSSASTISTTSAASTSGALSVISSSTTSGNPSQSPTSEIALAIVALVVLAAAAAYAALRRRRPPALDPATLRPDDIEMLRFIRDRGGKVVEAEIRERFSAPRTTAWRQAKRLEQLGYIRVSKLGSQNQLELVRPDFE
ncbi:MAG: hypothetical protein OK441_03885 [Thaumarchaeota archaeon]|nr:hypothetical protein [Nitrososphaerota archaeon]